MEIKKISKMSYPEIFGIDFLFKISPKMNFKKKSRVIPDIEPGRLK